MAPLTSTALRRVASASRRPSGLVAPRHTSSSLPTRLYTAGASALAPAPHRRGLSFSSGRVCAKHVSPGPGAGPSSAADASTATALQITDPLLIYRAKVASGELEEDGEQLRTMVALRNLARKLQDYTPPAHLLGVLSSSSTTPSSTHPTSSAGTTANPSDVKALTKWLSSNMNGVELNEFLDREGVPKGIMLTGPPGTGKSMCMDLFYESLPVRYKFRRHYHHLLLEIYRVIWLEAEKRRKALRGGSPPQPLVSSAADLEPTSSGAQVISPAEAAGDVSPDGTRATVLPKYGTGVFWRRGGPEGKGQGWRRVLKGMPFFRPDSLHADEGMGVPEDGSGSDALQSYSPQDLANGAAGASATTLALHAASHLFLTHGYVLLFDEVQLVDVASAGLLRRVLEAYWRLGGVVVATSNRLPDDLYKNNVQREQLTVFLETLKMRCEGWEMRAERDFRRVPGGNWALATTNAPKEAAAEGAADPDAALAATGQQPLATYFVEGKQSGAFAAAVDELLDGRQGGPSSVSVYGRTVSVPFAVSGTTCTSPSTSTVARFTFSELCDTPLGPADYLTLASSYRTIVVTGVPQLPLVYKNQARRLITFLDAAYEAGCLLLVEAAASPDHLFFPDAVRDVRVNPFALPHQQQMGGNGEPDDVVDMAAKGDRSPFLSPREGEHYPEEEHLEQQRRTKQQQQVLQDQMMTDSLIQSETLSEAAQDVDEGFRPNIASYDTQRAHRTERSESRRRTDDAASASSSSSTTSKSDPASLASLSIFSGEDEKFAFQRAVSRLYEMSHAAWPLRKRWRPFLSDEMEIWSGSDATTKQIDAEARARVASAAARSMQAPMSSGLAALEGKERLGTDFADEASYEAATFPGRHLPRTSMQGHQHDAPSPSERAYDDSEEGGRARRGAAPIVQETGGKGGFASGPIGKKSRGSRDGPPQINPNHVWGVREDWGPKAKDWGKGAEAFRRRQAGEKGGEE